MRELQQRCFMPFSRCSSKHNNNNDDGDGDNDDDDVISS